MPLAASLHGPGTPGESATLRPSLATACSTSTYGAIFASLWEGASTFYLVCGDCASIREPHQATHPRLRVRTSASPMHQDRTPSPLSFDDKLDIQCGGQVESFH